LIAAIFFESIINKILVIILLASSTAITIAAGNTFLHIANNTGL